MDAVTSVHPSDRVLASYGLGKLDESSAEAVNRHLENCVDCRRRVSELSSDSFLGRLQQVQKAPARSIPGGSLVDGTISFAPAGGTIAPPDIDTIPRGLVDHIDYEIRRELGRGGMGVVYLAHNTLMGRDEVLKVIGRQLMERPGVFDRFQREIRSVAKLHHPNIVTAYSAFRIEGGLVFAMEYVEGLDLSRLVKVKGPLSVSHSAYFAHQAALGLQHAHDRGTVHRDIKPHNLMLTHDGKARVIKVLDFGLAKATREGKLDSALTHEGQALGTPDYIAPEQILNATDVDIRADLYSLGGTLHFLLTGRPPFSANSLYDIYQAHISRDADPLNLVRPEVPAELAAIVSKLMAKDPDRRFQTPRDAAEALKPFFKSGTTRARSASAAFDKTLDPGPVSVAPEPPSEGSVPEPVEARRLSRLGTLFSRSRVDGKRETALGPTPLIADQPAQDDVLEPRKAWLSREFWSRNRVWPSIAASLGFVAILAAWMLMSDLRIKIPEGYLVFSDLPEKAVVLVDGQVVRVEWPGGGEPATVSVPRGGHKVKVTWKGVEIAGQEVEIAAGEKKPIKVQIVPGLVDLPVDTNGKAIDNFQPGSAWVRQDADATFVVVEREGERFRAIVLGPETDREIKGTIVGNRLRWQAEDIRVFSGPPGKGHSTEIIGDAFDVSWQNGTASGVMKWVLKKPKKTDGDGTNPTDRLQAGSVWLQDEGNVRFLIIERSGERFRALLFGDSNLGEMIREPHGTIRNGEFSWKSSDVRIIVGPPALNIVGTVKGDELWSTWSDSEGTVLGHSHFRLSNPPSEVPAKNDGADVGTVPDLLQVGSVWARDDEGWEFSVVERDGERFQATLVGPGMNKVIPGTIKAGRVSYRAGDVKVIEGNPSKDHDGEVVGDQLRLSRAEADGSRVEIKSHLKKSDPARSKMRPAPPTDDLVAFFGFDDGGTEDLSGHGNHGVLGPDPSSSFLQESAESVLKIDPGRVKRMTVPVDIGPTAMPRITIGGWFKVDEAGVENTMMSHDNLGWDRTLVIDPRGGGGFRWAVFAGSGVLGIAPVRPKQWTFFVLRHDQESGKLTVDVDEARVRREGITYNDGYPQLTVGVHPWKGNAGLPKDIDNIFLYKTVLSDDRIDEIRLRGRDAIVPAPGAEAPRSDSEKLQGAWVLANRNGEALPTEGPDRVIMTFKGDDWVNQKEGLPDMGGKFTIDPSKTPRELDLVNTIGRDAGYQAFGIYELHGDDLTFKFAPERPTDWSLGNGADRTRMNRYKRILIGKAP